ncbi:hypothetical protein [Paenibacillus dendritiformis]|uniref:hypothetical protein n=1 Tax=Paenibacillus dendritiformis TaxID=130049 RepID=UPI000DA86FFA|nr:hypothetical protein [Paenibacillus dendritiformis]PZM65971.1 hypothetical protein DOE73_09110 [Paenibacillus dendritiformis]
MSSKNGHKNKRNVHSIVTYTICVLCIAVGLTGCIGYRSEKTRSYDGNTTANYANRKTVQPLEKRPSTPNDSDIATPDYSAKGNSLERKQFARQELHRPNTLYVDRPLSALVSNMEGVAAGYVLKWNDTAYVALTFEGTANGVKGRGGNNTREQYGMGRIETSRKFDKKNPQAVTRHSPMRTLERMDDLSDEFLHSVNTAIRRHDPSIAKVYTSANKELFNSVSVHALRAYPGESLESVQDIIREDLRRYMR